MFGVETPFLISLAISAIGAFGYVGFRRYRIKNKHKRIPFHVWLPIILNALTFSSTIAGSVVVLAGWGSINSGSQMSTEYSSIYETIVTYVFLAIVVMPFVNAFTLKELTDKLDMLRCPSCGNEIQSSSFCPNCGHKVLDKCPKGHDVDPNDNFCRDCGAKLKP